jgi:DNA-binding LacI/PurR family transcriptional regulator
METGIDRTSKTPIFKQIYGMLTSEIEKGIYSPGGKLPSENELCLRFDVERNTVRKALQILVDEKRIERAPGIGTRILQAPFNMPSASVNQTSKIIILISQVDYLRSSNRESFHYNLIHSLENHLSRLGFNLLFKPVGKDGIVAETIRNVAPRGIIFDSLNHDTHYREAALSGLPCVSINHYTSYFTSIVSNNFEGAYQVTKLLIEAGHKKIAFITGKSSHQTTMERISGIQSFYAGKNLPLLPEYFISGDWTFSSGISAGECILAMKDELRPTAVFAFNDDLAYGCYAALHRHGLQVPDDMSIVGFDKSDRYNGMFPPITTVDVNLNAIVDYACWYLLDSLSGLAPRSRAKIQIDTTICENGSIKMLL